MSELGRTEEPRAALGHGKHSFALEHPPANIEFEGPVLGVFVPSPSRDESGIFRLWSTSLGLPLQGSLGGEGFAGTGLHSGWGLGEGAEGRRRCSGQT